MSEAIPPLASGLASGHRTDARSSHDVALAGTRLIRPSSAPGVEVAFATPANRSFPTHVSTTLGICTKIGSDHDIVADGRRLRYPRDAVSVRPAGCVWSSEPGVHGFVSIDIEPHLLPASLSGTSMTFADRSALPRINAAASALTTADSVLHAEQLVAQLVGAVVDAGLLSHEPAGARARDAVDTARDYLAAHLIGRPTLDDAAAAAGVDKFTLLRRFKQTLDTTPHAYLVMLRLARAQARLAAGASLGEAAYECGFADQSHLGRWFVRIHGITPAEYARQAHVAISFQTNRRSA